MLYGGHFEIEMTVVIPISVQYLKVPTSKHSWFGQNGHNFTLSRMKYMYVGHFDSKMAAIWTPFDQMGEIVNHKNEFSHTTNVGTDL